MPKLVACNTINVEWLSGAVTTLLSSYYSAKLLRSTSRELPLPKPTLLRQGLDFLFAQRRVIDTNVINQAGPEGPRFHSRTGTNVQTVF